MEIKIYRGGSFYSVVKIMRAVFRSGCASGFRYFDHGFRLVRTVKADKQVERWREEVEEGLFDGK